MIRSILSSLMLVVAATAGSVPAFAQGLRGEARAFHPEPAPYASNYGSRVAVDGDWLAVADHSGEDPTMQPLVWSAGFVEMYRRTSAGWEFSQVLTDPEHWFAGSFGQSIAIHGDVLVVANP
ncbi:MAG TPA: hypothetical protein PLJ12_01260, partial [Planctomycetota bacterium]|nr:hypothetical protein [Planctomycetota bacterium]